MNLNAFLTDNGMTLELVVWSMFAGICLATLVIMYNKNVLGPFVRALLEAGATSPQSAKSLSELGFTNKALVRLSLKKKGAFRKIVQVTAIDMPSVNLPPPPLPETGSAETVGELGEPDKKTKSRKRPNLDELRFFIPEAMVERADSIYLNGGASLVVVLITIASFLVVALLLFKVIPALLQMIQNLVEYLSLSAD